MPVKELPHDPSLDPLDTPPVIDHPAIVDFLGPYSRYVRESPDATAIVSATGTLSYRDLEARANQLAHLLLARGAGPDVPIAISLPRSVEMIVAVLGILKAGSAYVPLDPSYPADRLHLMLDDSGAPVVLTTSDGASRLGCARPRTILLDLDAESLRSQSRLPPERTADGDDLAYIIYTSGSTGRPKGVALPRVALSNLVAWQLRQPGFAAGANTLQFASLSFDVSFQEIFTTLASGGTLYLVDEHLRRDPVRLLRFIDQHAIRRLFLPFVALRQLAGAAVSTQVFPHALREIYTAGEQLFVTADVRHLFRHLPGAMLGNQYGPSETHVVTALLLTGSPDEWPDAPSIGRPIDHAQIVVLDENRLPVPDGTQGEAYITGLCLARCYLHRLDLTHERFVNLPLPEGRSVRAYKSGDLVVRRLDGEIVFVGRADHQVKIRGHRVEPAGVATVLSAAPGLAQCHVVAHEIQAGIKSLIAYYKPADDSAVSVDALRDFARRKLPPYMVPSVFHRVDEFPLTPSGKVDVKALPVPDVGTIGADTYVPPQSDTERRLVVIWQDVLKISRLSVTADFFEVGGHSLLVVSLFERIHRAFGTDLPYSLLINAPTVRAMAAELDAGRQHARADLKSLVPIQATGHRIPVFMIHGGLGNVLSFPIVARGLGDDQPFYALQWSGVDGRRAPTTSRELVRDYLHDIRSVRPHGPYVLGGMCIGGLMAYEIARQLREAGEDVPLVVMYDAPNVWSDAYGPEADPAQPKPRLSDYLRIGPFVCTLARLSGLPVPARYRTLRIALAMVRVFNTHRFVRADDLDILYITAGACLPRSLGLTGHWTDDLLGWTPILHDRFEVVHVDGSDHERVAHDVQSIEALKRRLDLVNTQRFRHSPGYDVRAAR